MSRKIVITEPFGKRHIEKIKQVVPDDFEVVFTDAKSWDNVLKEAEVVVGQPPVEYLQSSDIDCPHLKFIQMTWAGTDIYTRSTLPFPKDKIMLANGSGAYGMIMSQFVVGMILSTLLNFKQYYRQQDKELWQRDGRIQSLEHAKVLIFGAGNIGTAVAKRLTGFDTYTIGVCRNVDAKRKYFDELCTLEDAEKYLPEADIVVGCIPNSDETNNYLNSDRLSMMKNTAVIVNVGRGNFIDCMALDRMLRDGKLFGAALDVTNPEPLPKGHPLWDNPYCMITPHASGVTFGHLDVTEDMVCDIVCENLRRYCAGEEINNRIF